MKIQAECFIADDPDSPTRYASFEVDERANTGEIQIIVDTWKLNAFPQAEIEQIEGAWWVDTGAEEKG
jgi:hypothetical protein